MLFSMSVTFGVQRLLLHSMLEECVGDEWERSWELEDLTNIHSEYKNQELEIYKPSQESCNGQEWYLVEKKRLEMQ